MTTAVSSTEFFVYVATTPSGRFSWDLAAISSIRILSVIRFVWRFHKVIRFVCWRNICPSRITVTASTDSLAVEMGCQLGWRSCMWLQLEPDTKRDQNRRIIGWVESSVKILACCYTIWWDQSKLHPWTACHPSIFYTSLFMSRVVTSWCLYLQRSLYGRQVLDTSEFLNFICCSVRNLYLQIFLNSPNKCLCTVK